jgi:C4-dicarboxylate-specific signal transduction histidine kinase
MVTPGIGSYGYRGNTDLRRPPAFEEETQTALTHANRVAAIGQLSVSIVHEVSQPISATLFNAQTALEVLSESSPDIEGVRRAITRILRDCNRAVNVLSCIRSMVRKTPSRTDDCRLNEAVAEVVELTYGEATDNLCLLRPTSPILSPSSGATASNCNRSCSIWSSMRSKP